MDHGMMGRAISGGQAGNILSWLSNSFLFHLLFILVVVLIVLYVVSVMLPRMRQVERPEAKPSKFKCYNCGLDISEEFRFCPQCSVSLLTVCSTCQHTVHRTWVYCPHCSTKIKSE